MSRPSMPDYTDNVMAFYDPSTGHYAIRALKDFPADCIVETFTAKEYLEQATYLSVQVGENSHIHLFPELLQYTNHSCEPNTFFDTQTGEIIAIRPIVKHEEITFFYPATEWLMAQAFTCFCNTADCLGVIQGAAHLDSLVRQKYRFSAYIQKKFSER